MKEKQTIGEAKVPLHQGKALGHGLATVEVCPGLIPAPGSGERRFIVARPG